MIAAAARTALFLGFVFCAGESSAVDASDRYRSPRNPERKIRRSTELIILHTTEAPARSSLNKLSDRGEAHYCVTEEGRIFRIVDRDREAFHAGRSMWRGKEDVDKFSIGIECVGYHNRPMGTVQLTAIRTLVKELQSMYNLSDDRVICHSHVAYGAPNKWQRRRHRGRKRCGMLFAMPSVRRRLGLTSKPAFDPDTRARRLTVGDEYLSKVLYGSVDTMAGRSPAPNAPAAAAPRKGEPKSGGGMFSRWFGKDSAKTPAPSRSPPERAVARPPPAKAAKPPPVKNGRQPMTKAGLKPAPDVKADSAGTAPKTVEELKSGGFVLKGTISRNVSALRIVGSKWNAPDTYYTFRGKVTAGDKVDPMRMEMGMGVWRKN
jgi:hypothetical protein